MLDEVKHVGFPVEFAKKMARVSEASHQIEIKEALDRVTAYEYLPRHGDIELDDNGEPTGYVVIAGLYEDDVTTIVAAYRAIEAAREQREGERAIRIDSEWLLSIGFIESVGELVIESVWHQVTVDTGTVKLFNKQTMQCVAIGRSVSTTRGEMLDFLAGLKIPMRSAA